MNTQDIIAELQEIIDSQVPNEDYPLTLLHSDLSQHYGELQAELTNLGIQIKETEQMIKEDQAQVTFDNLFRYHAPTLRTAPIYAFLREAEQTLLRELWAIERTYVDPLPVLHGSVSSACHTFAKVINKHCPSSADTTAAICCVRLARMACNEGLSQETRTEMFSYARTKILEARWLACSAVACSQEQP